jgi:hypothetical protein
MGPMSESGGPMKISTGQVDRDQAQDCPCPSTGPPLGQWRCHGGPGRAGWQAGSVLQVAQAECDWGLWKYLIMTEASSV